MKKGLKKIPPFHDSHIHFMIEGREASLNESLDLIRQLIFAGIVAGKDMGHKSGLGLKLKKVAAQEGFGPFRIQSAGRALHKTGGYGGFLGKGVAGKIEIQKAIRKSAEMGADFIKIINSGIVTFGERNPVSDSGFSREEWKVIQEEAGIQGLPICCHANTDRAIRQAIDFGVSSIEHGFFISKETLFDFAEKGVSWTPTAAALLSLKAFLPTEQHFQLDKIMERHLEAIAQAANLKVRLQVGTDSGSKGVRPGESFFKELQLFRKAGLTSEQILSSACLDPAEMEQENYLLVEKNFIEMEKVEAVYINSVQKQKDLIG
jgi:imidazolonepropionase-like amidohydrolase